MANSTPGTSEYESHFWAFNRVVEMWEDADAVWHFVLAVLAADTSDRVLGNLAAGPLEELLVDHPHMIERVEAEARSNLRFARLLCGVWQNDMSDVIWNRLQAVCDRSGIDDEAAT